MDFVVAPDFAALSDISGFGGVDAAQDTDAFAMFRVLAYRDIDAVFVKDGSGVDLAGAFGGRIFKLFPFGRIAIILPGCFQKSAVALLHRFWIECVANAIASAEEDLLATVDHGERR